MGHGRPSIIAAILLAATLALALAACGSDDETTTVTETVGTESTTETAATETAPPDPQTGTDPVGFQTPSGNIGCYVDVNAARCDISQRSWTPTPEPASCKSTGLDYGQGIIVTHDRAEFVCAGDTTLGAGDTLAYGESVERGAYLCESANDGVTCTETETGHGFFISKQSFRIF
jgi:hypothetical protein